MIKFENGKMIIIDGEEENRILCEIFNCSPEVLTPKYADHTPKTSAYTEARPNEA